MGYTHLRCYTRSCALHDEMDDYDLKCFNVMYIVYEMMMVVVDDRSLSFF